jgi:SH3-like domain-containing protein
MESPNSKAHVRLKYEVEYRNPIQVKAGARVEVGRADNDYPGWLWCRSAGGHEGWIPFELLSIRGAVATVLEDYSATELAVQPGDEVDVQEIRHGWARVKNTQGEVGWVPTSHIDI